MQLLIADDEWLTLELMKNIINWETYGIHIADAVLNGTAAQEVISSKQIDILITDIKMPGVDGIELIKWVRTTYPNIKIIIISAYGEFEYAKKALSLGVMGYLLKPIDELELEELLAKTLEELKAERHIEKNLQENRKVAKERLLKQFLHPRKDIEKLIDTNKSIGINMELDRFWMLNISIDNLSYDDFLYFNEINDDGTQGILQVVKTGVVFCENGKNTFAFENNSGEWIVIIDMPCIDPKQISRSIIDDLYKRVKIKSFVAISEMHFGITELRQAYAETLNIIKYRFYIESSDIIEYQEINKDFSVQELDAIEKQKLFMQYLDVVDQNQAEELIEDIFKDFSHKSAMDPESIYWFCYELLILVKQKAKMGNKEEASIPELKDINIESLKCYKTLLDLKTYMLNIVQKILSYSKSDKKSENNRLIQKAKEYIRQYFDTNITLEALCSSICVSKNYFCYLFKREVGESIWDYLTRYRIEKAKQLLEETNMKNYEVAYKIGYENPSYFTKTFKKYTGYTPQEYRDSN